MSGRCVFLPFNIVILGTVASCKWKIVLFKCMCFAQIIHVFAQVQFVLIGDTVFSFKAICSHAVYENSDYIYPVKVWLFL